MVCSGGERVLADARLCSLSRVIAEFAEAFGGCEASRDASLCAVAGAPAGSGSDSPEAASLSFPAHEDAAADWAELLRVEFGGVAAGEAAAGSVSWVRVIAHRMLNSTPAACFVLLQRFSTIECGL